MTITVSCVLEETERFGGKESIFEVLISHIKDFRLNLLFPNIYETCKKRGQDSSYEIERRDGGVRRFEPSSSSQKCLRNRQKKKMQTHKTNVIHNYRQGSQR